MVLETAVCVEIIGAEAGMAEVDVIDKVDDCGWSGRGGAESWAGSGTEC